MFGLFDRHRSTDRSYTVSVFAIGKYDLPSPAAAINQLNDGVFKSLVLHQSPSAESGAGHRRTWTPSKFTCELKQPLILGMEGSNYRHQGGPLKAQNFQFYDRANADKALGRLVTHFDGSLKINQSAV